MSGNLLNSSAVMAFFAIPSTVIWSYLAFGVALAIGLVTIFLRGDWQKARGLDKLILFGPLFYAAPLAAFGTEHFTLTKAVASIVPRVDSVASVLGVLRRRLLYRSRAEPGDEDPGASGGEFARLDVFPFRSADGRPRLGTQSAGSVWSDVDAAGTILQRRRSGAGSQPCRAGARARQARPCDDRAILRRHSRAVLQLRAIHARRSRSRRSAGTADSAVDLRTRHLDVPGGRGLRSRGYPVACRQEDPRGSHVDRPDRALRGVSRLRADRSRGARQPRQRPQLHGGYTDVLRRHSSARGRHAARSGAAGIIGRSVVPRNPRLPKPGRRIHFDRRVAQALPPGAKTVGAPSFAHFAKGGNLERMRDQGCAEPTKVVSAASLPALAKNARTGHPQHRWRTQTSSKGAPPALFRPPSSRVPDPESSPWRRPKTAFYPTSKPPLPSCRPRSARTHPARCNWAASASACIRTNSPCAPSDRYQFPWAEARFRPEKNLFRGSGLVDVGVVPWFPFSSTNWYRGLPSPPRFIRVAFLPI